MVRSSHPLLSEATDAGFLGASAVALWFLVLDTVRGHPLLTPSVLGQLFLMGNEHPDTRTADFAAVIMYTPVHFILFLLFAALLAWLVRLSCEHSVVRFAILVLFVAFELCFYVVVNVVSSEVGALFPLWAVAGANLLAAIVM